MSVSRTTLLLTVCLNAAAAVWAAELPWRSPNRYRLLIHVDCRGVPRSNCPASLDVDFVKQLSDHGIAGTFDERTIEAIGYDRLGTPRMYDAAGRGYERYLLPWRLRKRYGANTMTLSFVVPDETVETYAIYFDTVESGLGSPRRYPGLVGDGDFFRQDYGQRAIAACHFDCFSDPDGDGDLDLFQGGVEPFVYCYENIGENRFLRRGKLTSGGDILTLPRNKHTNRSWVVPHFFDWDGDGDQDFFPSFMDGPYAGKIVFFENVTSPNGPLTFADRGLLVTSRGTAVAGGKQAGGWFPSVAFVTDFLRDGDGRTDLIVGSNNHIYFYRNRGPDESKTWRLDEAVALKAAGREIELFNPCLDVGDVDSDGDWDLFVAPQSGPIHWFENTGATEDGRIPVFAEGVVVAYDDRNLQQSGHPRVTVADFTSDGLLDLAVDRAWELADLDHLSDDRDYGALFKNVGDAAHPKWERATRLAETPHTEGFPICHALRQNVVRAVDWNNDGKTDLLAGDCDGFVWYFQNRTNNVRPIFAAGRRLLAGGQVLSRASHQGHARHDVCDWNNDGRQDLIVSDGAGLVTAYLNEGSDAQPALGPGRAVTALDDHGDPAPIDRGTRSHLLVCDWNNDGKKDLIFSDQQNPGFYEFPNVGTDSEPLFAPAKNIGLTPYVRPNLGSFVDWDGDGRRDLIACEFEHSVRFYRNVGSGALNAPPVFDNPDGQIVLKPYCIMMISGADVVDWNGDGDLDILTGQGHGGSGLRFYERDYIEDCLNETHPIVTVERFEKAPTDALTVVQRYADAMLEHVRDVYGRQRTGLLLSALDRHRLQRLDVRPEPPGGIRREDRAGLPWKPLTGANPQLDQNLLRILYTLTELMGDSRYGDVAD